MDEVTEPIEQDHELVWLPLEDCISELFLDHQAYAIEKVSTNVIAQEKNILLN